MENQSTSDAKMAKNSGQVERNYDLLKKNNKVIMNEKQTE